LYQYDRREEVVSCAGIMQATAPDPVLGLQDLIAVVKARSGLHLVTAMKYLLAVVSSLFFCFMII